MTAAQALAVAGGAPIEPLTSEVEEPVDPDLLNAIRERLDAGLTDEQRQQVALLLVKQITVYTTVKEDGTKEVKLVIEYRFSASGVVTTDTGTGSWRQRA